MSTKKTRLTRLLDRGFYPTELPPPFQTRGFANAANSIHPTNSYSGSTLFYDAGTFRGQSRQFGIINPISYLLLSRFLADHWEDIKKIYDLSSSSGARPRFPSLASSGRAVHMASIARKRKSEQHLASIFPIVLALDINRFYGSIYTHSLSWAVLGKGVAKRMHKQNTLKGHWSDTLDRLIRSCNQSQTIRIPIGPDTSRIVSELLLARIDSDIVAKGTKIVSGQLYHNIDDYQIGVPDLASAEEAQSRFVRTISQYELRLNDFKTTVDHGMEFLPRNFQRNFDILDYSSRRNFVEHFFEIVYTQVALNPNSNVLGYALRRFAKRLTSEQNLDLVCEYLQRITFATPYQIRWILPILLSAWRGSANNAEAKRLILWGLETCARRNDIGNLLWYLYAAICMKIKLNGGVCNLCFELSNGLIDLMLLHGKQLSLFHPPLVKLRQRYRDADFRTASWLPLYEIGRRSWDNSASFSKLGGADDHSCLYQQLAVRSVEFYVTDEEYFGLEAFGDWWLEAPMGSTREKRESGDVSFLIPSLEATQIARSLEF